MVVSVVPGSVFLKIKSRPSARLPDLVWPKTAPWVPTKAVFDSFPVLAEGECKITGSATDSPQGWTLGWIQLQWVMTEWAYYRGQSNVDGDCFLQFARPPARPTQGCRDTLNPGAIFADNMPGYDKTVAHAGQPFPITLKALLADGPDLSYPLTRVNSKTGSTNFLSEVQIEVHMCSVLSLRNPEPRRGPAIAGTYTHLKHLFWYLHWQAQFQPTDYTNIAERWTITRTGGPMANKGDVHPTIFDGGPTDPKFTRIITAGGAPNCNVLARRNTANVRESRIWTNYDVRR